MKLPEMHLPAAGPSSWHSLRCLRRSKTEIDEMMTQSNIKYTQQGIAGRLPGHCACPHLIQLAYCEKSSQK